MRRALLVQMVSSCSLIAALVVLASSDVSAQLPPQILPQHHPDITVDFPHCGATTVPVEMMVSGPANVTFAATALRGARVSFDPPTVSVPKANVTVRTTMTLTLDFLGNSAPLDQAMTVTAGTATQRFDVRRKQVTLREISPTNVQTPRFGRPGTEVTLLGTGFCNNNTTVVEVNGRQVLPVHANGLGTELRFETPFWAADGPVTVTAFPEGRLTSAPLMVDSMRNVNGFAWANSGPFKDGLGDWNINDFIDDFHANPLDPATWALLPFADIVFGEGNCFGFSTLSGRMLTGQMSSRSFAGWDGATFDPVAPQTPSAADPWHIWGHILQLGGSRAHDAPIAKQIHNAQLMQLSTEVLSAFLTASNFGGDKSNLHDTVARYVNAGKPAIISLAGGCKHAVLAYGLRDHADGSFDVDVLDSNRPFELGEPHFARVLETALHVATTGSFDYDDQRDITDPHVKCGGSLSDIRVLDLASVPVKGTLPSADLISFLAHFAAGAAVTQVTDAAGRTLLEADGSVVRDATRRIPDAMRFFPATGRAATLPLFYMKGGTSYTYTLRGTASASVPMWHVGPGLVAHVESYPMTPGAVDTVVFDHAKSAIELRGSANKQVVVRLVAQTPAGTKFVRVRTTLAAGAPMRLGFDAAKDTILYTHGGPAVPVGFDLGFQTGKTPEVKLTTATLTVGPNEGVTVKPTWTSLATGAGQLVHKSAKGVETPKLLK
jgi:hypothetical protein